MIKYSLLLIIAYFAHSRQLFQDMTTSSSCFEDCLAKDKVFCIEKTNF